MVNQKNPQQTNFETSDLPVAAFLRAKRIPLVGTRQDKGRIFFQFSHPKAEALAFSFFNDAKVPASSFSRAFQELKTLVHGRI